MTRPGLRPAVVLTAVGWLDHVESSRVICKPSPSQEVWGFSDTVVLVARASGACEAEMHGRVPEVVR